MEKYYRINKTIAARAGFTALLRTEVGDDLLLSASDLRNISLTSDERALALGGVEYVAGDDNENENDLPAEDDEQEYENEVEPINDDE